MMCQRFHFEHKVNGNQKMQCSNIGNLESVPATSLTFVLDDPFKVNVVKAIIRIMEFLRFRFFRVFFRTPDTLPSLFPVICQYLLY
jgi:hypothetical protein